MKTRWVLLLVPFLLVSIVQAQNIPLAEHPEVASSIRLLAAWIESQIAYRGLPGMSIGIVFDQILMWSRGFGYSDVEKKIPATPTTIYRVASVTKLFTATAIMQLRDAGKLQLDDPVAKYLPWFTIRTRDADMPPITIRHLLTHTAGLPREAAFPYWTDNNFPTREQIIETLPNQETIFAPETKWKYSNLALSVAGELVSTVSGEAYATATLQYEIDGLHPDQFEGFLRDLKLATSYRIFHIPSDFVVDRWPQMVRAAQPLISRCYTMRGRKTNHKITATISTG